MQHPAGHETWNTNSVVPIEPSQERQIHSKLSLETATPREAGQVLELRSAAPDFQGRMRRQNTSENAMRTNEMPSTQIDMTSNIRQLRAPRIVRQHVQNSPQHVRVLIADNNSAAAESLRSNLACEGCLCEVTSSGEHALDVVRDLACDVVICTVGIQGASGFALLDRIKEIQPELPVIIGTSSGPAINAAEAKRHGAFQCIDNLRDTSRILSCIIQATVDAQQYGKARAPIQSSAGSIDQAFVQESSAMRELSESIALVARSNTPVLILGETGTGKERVARAIHAASARSSQPFVAVNTSAIPEQLLESEVFGHVRGAFTGATQTRRGLMQEAHGGTLLLDEIGDMPLGLQPKLLRVLQFGESRPVGSDRTNQLDVRVIAATHRDLGALVREGSFREDLRYRLNIIPLTVPPLRSRRQDILPLVAQFLREAKARNLTSPVDAFSDEAADALVHAPWPGNVRELENTIERLVVLGREAKVTAADLLFLQQKPTGESWPSIDNSPLTLKEMNRRYLRWVLAQTNGDKVRAAGILDIDLSTLYRWERPKE